MKVYIAGKITGDQDYRAKFERAAKALEAEGHVALNPAAFPDGLTEENYITPGISMLNCADVAAFLPDWEDSEGAKVERANCQKVGKPIIDLWRCESCKHHDQEITFSCDADGWENEETGLGCARWGLREAGPWDR